MPTHPVYDRVRFAGIVESQHYVVTRAQAMSCGITRSMIDYRVSPRGPWRPLLPSVYLTVTGTVTRDQREMAALLYAGPSCVITGPAALRRYGLPCEQSETVDVLGPMNNWHKSAGFVRLERTTRLPGYRQSGLIRYALAPRAIADTARGMERYVKVEALVCAGVQRNLVTVAELRDELQAGQIRGSAMLRRALNEASAGIWSSAEGDFKRLVDRSGLEKPVYNTMLFTLEGEFLGCADAWWGRAGVAAEIDSRMYHLDASGYAKTMDHHNALTRAGVVVLHWLPSTVTREPTKVISDLRAALRAGEQRPPLPICTFTQTGDGLAYVSGPALARTPARLGRVGLEVGY
jgi:hypothetical protein